MMDFISIDFETANAEPNSICSIGMVKTLGSNITEERYYLVRPPDMDFDPFNIAIHGIHPEDVEDQPTFDERWPEIYNFIGNMPLVAHFAQFDMRVLRKTLEHYAIDDYPQIPYCCSWVISKKMWPGHKSYKLNLVCDLLGITFEHHNALEDARATALILIQAAKETNSTSIDELSQNLKFRIGSLFPGGYIPLVQSTDAKSRHGIKPSELIPATTNFDQGHPLFDKVCLFTGTLESMQRREAAQRVVDLGGHFANNFNKTVDYLVCGEQDFTKLRSDKSSKMQKVEEALAAGQNVEILSELDFIKLLNG